MTHSHPTNGYALPELMITVVIIGILASVASFGLLVSSRLWGLRNAAVELAGYLENAQAIAAGSTENCTLAITGVGGAQQIGPTNAENNACASLAATQLLPSSPIPLALKQPSVTTFTLLARGLVSNTITTRLTADNTGNGEYCVQVLAPSALVAVGVWQGGEGGVCNHAAFN